MTAILRFALLCALSLLLAGAPGAVIGSAPPPDETAGARSVDEQAERRIREIFAEIETLEAVDVEVRAGVAQLSGRTLTAAAAERAEALAAGVAGIVAVENEIERDVSVPARVSPALEETRTLAREIVRTGPLIALALLVFATIVLLGWLIARWTSLWRRIAPNPFLLELTRASIRIVFFILALIAALSLLDATPLLGAVLGAAGVLGLAIGFGLRDVVENYMASVLLSVRQPFRPDDHVSIDGREGRVARVTPRATILVTLDGNQLRLPNAAVFKAAIVNYTVNPQRRFDFDLAIETSQDPVVAINAGCETLSSLEFILKQPPPTGVVTKIEAKTVIAFGAWIDQRRVDFAKSRSVALTSVKQRLDTVLAEDARPAAAKEAPARLDASPEQGVARMVEEERRLSPTPDLLSGGRPE